MCACDVWDDDGGGTEHVDEQWRRGERRRGVMMADGRLDAHLR